MGVAVSGMYKARLHPKWTKSGYRYAVLFEGRLIVANSRDPELDAARALVAMGLSGKLTVCDGKTGKPRTIIDIEMAAKLRTVETGNAPRFRNETYAESPQTAETDEAEGQARLA